MSGEVRFREGLCETLQDTLVVVFPPPQMTLRPQGVFNVNLFSQ